MGGSIHIHGTASSIVDTVFVCRHRGTPPRASLFRNTGELVQLMAHELDELREGGMKPTAGDIRCIAFGHITRMAIWNLRADWDAARPTGEKLTTIRQAMDTITTADAVRATLEGAALATMASTPTKTKEKRKQANAATF